MSYREEIEQGALSTLRDIYSKINYDVFKKQAESQNNLGCVYHIQFYFDKAQKDIRLLKVGQSKDGIEFDYNVDYSSDIENAHRISYINGKTLDSRGNKYVDIDNAEKYISITLPSAPDYSCKGFKDFLNNISDNKFLKFYHNLKKANLQRQKSFIIHDMIKRKSSMELVFDLSKVETINNSVFGKNQKINDYFIYFFKDKLVQYVGKGIENEEIYDKDEGTICISQEPYSFSYNSSDDFDDYDNYEGIGMVWHPSSHLLTLYKNVLYSSTNLEPSTKTRFWILPINVGKSLNEFKERFSENNPNLELFIESSFKRYTFGNLLNYYGNGSSDSTINKIKTEYTNLNYNYLYNMMPNCVQAQETTLCGFIPKGNFTYDFLFDDKPDTKGVKKDEVDKNIRLNSISINDLYQDYYFDKFIIDSSLDENGGTQKILFKFPLNEVEDDSFFDFYIKIRGQKYFVHREIEYELIKNENSNLVYIKFDIDKLRNTLYTEELVEGTLLRCIVDNRFSFYEELTDVRDLPINGKSYCNQMYKIKNPINKNTLNNENCFVFLNGYLLIPEVDKEKLEHNYHIVGGISNDGSNLVNRIKLIMKDDPGLFFRTFYPSDNGDVELTNDYLKPNSDSFSVVKTLSDEGSLNNYLTTLYGDYYFEIGDNRYRENVSYLMLKRRRNYMKNDINSKLEIYNNRFRYPDNKMKPIYFFGSTDESADNRIKLVDDKAVIFSNTYDLNPYNIEVYKDRKRVPNSSIISMGYTNIVGIKEICKEETELIVIVKYNMDPSIYNSLTEEEKSFNPKMTLEEFNNKNDFAFPKNDIVGGIGGNIIILPAEVVGIDRKYYPITEESYENNPLEYNLFLTLHMIKDRMDALRIYKNARVINANNPLSDEDYTFNKIFSDTFFPLTYLSNKIDDNKKYILRYPYEYNLYLLDDENLGEIYNGKPPDDIIWQW